MLTPSIQQLEALDRSVSETRILIRHWLSVQSGPLDPEKVQLQRLMDEDIPQQVQALLPLVANWSDPALQAQFDSLSRDIEHVFLVYREIMRLLPTFQAYEDPIAMMDAEYYALDGSSIPAFTSRSAATWMPCRKPRPTRFGRRRRRWTRWAPSCSSTPET